MRRPEYVWFDLETTGLSHPIPGVGIQDDPAQDEIIQLAAIATGGAPGFEETDRFEVKIWPTDNGLGRMERGHAETGFAFRFNKAEWAPPRSYTVTPACLQFKDFLDRHKTVKRISKAGKPYYVAQLAGHNISKFDIPFLFATFKKQGMFLPASRQGLDTLTIWPWLEACGADVPPTLKLEDLCKRYKIKLDNAHDAMADVEATVELGRRIIQSLAQWD